MEGAAPQKIWGLRRGCEADLETVKNDRNGVFYRGLKWVKTTVRRGYKSSPEA